MSLSAFVGTFIDFPTLGSVNIRYDHALVIDEKGFIVFFDTRTYFLENYHGIRFAEIPVGSFVMPSFCDLHLHAPQFLYQGNGLHLPLMDWLHQYAFKAEERLDADVNLALRTYTRLAYRLKQHGTGAVLMFGTIKSETNLILAKVMQDAGIRAFVGKLSMDQYSKDSYRESSAKESLKAARSYVEDTFQAVADLQQHQRLVEPVLTPRFVPTCSDELLEGLGELAQSRNLRIQSHLAEARDQVDWVHRERGAFDIDVFDKESLNNLLTGRTVQAHCTFLSDTCFHRMAIKGSSIAHCPLSNAYFSSQPFRLREALDIGTKVGLGTDIAGGYSIDIMNAMRSAVLVSRMREGDRTERNLLKKETGDDLEVDLESKPVSINWKESLHLATKGGAIALGLPEGCGEFVVGAPFDAQMIKLYDGELGEGTGQLDFFEDLTKKPLISEEMLEKWWCVGDTVNRTGLWIQGRRVFPFVE